MDGSRLGAELPLQGLLLSGPAAVMPGRICPRSKVTPTPRGSVHAYQAAVRALRAVFLARPQVRVEGPSQGRVGRVSQRVQGHRIRLVLDFQASVPWMCVAVIVNETRSRAVAPSSRSQIWEPSPWGKNAAGLRLVSASVQRCVATSVGIVTHPSAEPVLGPDPPPVTVAVAGADHHELPELVRSQAPRAR